MAGFPVQLGGMVYGRPLLLPLGPTPHLHIIFTAQNGFLYLIDTHNDFPCVDRIDLGENSYGMVLADDLTGDGKMDLLVAGRLGNIFCLSTPAPFDPELVVRSGEPGVMGGWHGIHIEASRQQVSVYGDSFSFDYHLLDKRPLPKPHNYRISLKMQGKSKGERMATDPGIYSEVLPCPPNVLVNARVSIEMRNEFGQFFTDSFAVSCNQHFAKMMKWVVVLPFALCLLVLFFVREFKKGLMPR